MAELEHVIAGEWFEVRERIHHADQLFDFLVEQDPERLAPGLWEATADDLERAIEGGIYEFKRRRLVVQLSKLEEAAYTSELFGALARERIDATALLTVCATQRALLAGELRFLSSEEERRADGAALEGGDTRADAADGPGGTDGTPAGGPAPSGGTAAPPSFDPLGDGASTEAAGATGVDAAADAAANTDIKKIVTDVQEIVASDPSMKMNAAIKNILLQLAKYREEASTYQKLKEQATSYRLEMYSKTFSASFGKIFESIRKNYRSFLDEQEEIRRRSRGTILDDIEPRPWARLILQQMEEISRIRSTFLFVEKEHSGMREPLVALAKRRDAITALLDREQELAEDLAGGEDAGHRLGRILAVEVARHLRAWARE